MSNAVQVTGIPRDMPGLKGSLATFRKHNKEVGDALLNLAGVGTVDGKMADVEDPRPPYQHQSWPKMVYHADGREAIVDDQSEYDHHVAQGFRSQPYPKPQVAVEDPKVEKARLIKDAADARAQTAQLMEKMQQMQEQLNTLTAAQAQAQAQPETASKRK